jgi:alanyl-tRNA synthetase
VPQDDPTTLFTGSGMQPLIPYLLGEPHPEGNSLVDSQTCFRAEDMDEVATTVTPLSLKCSATGAWAIILKQEQLSLVF